MDYDLFWALMDPVLFIVFVIITGFIIMFLGVTSIIIFLIIYIFTLPLLALLTITITMRIQYREWWFL